VSWGFANGKAFGLTVAIFGSLLFGDGDGDGDCVGGSRVHCLTLWD
jgi:hypothetical protein